MLGLLREDAEAIVQAGLTPIVWTRQQMEWLAEAVRSSGADAAGGASGDRYGHGAAGVVPGEELRDLLAWLAGQRELRLDGVMTHFASSEVADSALTLQQRERFEQALS